MSKLNKLRNYCITIGNLPTSYVNSLSYYETLVFLIKYIKETVIPAINTNAEAIKELQEYFENLDVQEEINNKLDDMAESGQLEEIISTYLNIKAELCFNTITDMKNATNLIDGCFVKCYGIDSYQDGKFKYYKIRTKTEEDVIDEVNILAITSDDSIIAELIINDIDTTLEEHETAINALEINMTNAESNINSLLPLVNKKYIFIGDSYNEGYGNPNYDGWGTILKDYLNINSSQFYNMYEGGSGFVNVGNSGHTFQSLLESYENTITDKNSITDIIIVGGYNDKGYTESAINLAIGSMMSYIKTNYPKAKVYIGMVGNNSDWSNSGLIVRNNLAYKVLPAYKDCQKYGAIYLQDIEYSNHNYDIFFNDNVHLTDYSTIAKSIYNCLNNNGTQLCYADRSITIYDSGLPNFGMNISMHNGLINIRSGVNRISGLSFTLNRYAQITNNFNPHFLRARFTEQKITIPVDIDITYNNGDDELYTMAYLIIDLVNKELTIFTLEQFIGVTAINIGSFDITLDANSF